MDKQVRARYTNAIYHAALERFAIDPAHVTALDGFESFIYAFTRPGNAPTGDARDDDRQAGQDFVLRIGHSIRRPASLVLGEVDWLNYLAQQGTSVAYAVPSAVGNYVESIDDGHGAAFVAAAFVKAAGLHPWQLEGGWIPPRVERYGELIGRMHAVTRSYQPIDPRAQRPLWEGQDIQDAPANLPASEQVALAKHYATFDEVMKLPRPVDAYGLIHFDAHSANMLIDEDERITLFDFDDCCYSWFANDIAIVLFYSVLGQSDPAAYTAEFMTHFLRGYRREHQLDPMWLATIPAFMKLREIDLYGAIHRSMDVTALDDPWVIRYMDGRKARIEQDVPLVDFDFMTLAPLLA